MKENGRSPSAPQHSQSSVKKAVALKYSPEQGKAPVLIAKGKGHVAEKIMQKAKEHHIPVQEDPSLVEVLSKLDLDQEIPPELYKLVAEILTFIYRSDQRAKRMRTMPYE
ncbi:EscU/YscU/HrcU family type III secretion system export apparatus switch protein [Paenibacillus doosanensis]|uniref:Flagellar biosynthetic protein FlhB n=1 Tax=Paenibacillus konkukensis TaxID=2020716 RepID=A0ABY4RYU7_9BACL|nr:MULTISPECIES: EscU/YscU/HrcU family type III secretion system export apparatus switch protein [Paenibacillus]MCS7461914.1 EscU/YscU/HrcU family type III secretion system export apparatus switch protein [Paenibacillus doosanensis]UQZ87317.1 Flagellar biosynthetic protein FlhB [Paenibacillus konkukensis]